MLRKLQLWRLRRRYRTGQTRTRFIAKDIRRDVEIVDDSQIETGKLTVRTRTWNVLYAIRGIQSVPSFGDSREVSIPELWKWSGESWGGPVPSSTGGET